MAFTMQAVVDKARIPLNDSAKDRWVDADLLGYANDAIRVLRKGRPDLFFGQYLTLPGDKVLGDTLPVDDEHFVAVCDYVTARAETRNDEFALRQRATLFFQLASG